MLQEDQSKDEQRKMGKGERASRGVSSYQRDQDTHIALRFTCPLAHLMFLLKEGGGVG